MLRAMAEQYQHNGHAKDTCAGKEWLTKQHERSTPMADQWKKVDDRPTVDVGGAGVDMDKLLLTIFLEGEGTCCSVCATSSRPITRTQLRCEPSQG